MNIPLATITLTQREHAYVSEALAANWISGTGYFVPRFERALSERLERTHVIATANGTLALELALRALGIGVGDEVIVPAFTFVAPAAVVRAVGATPVLVDVCASDWTLDAIAVEQAITLRTRAVIAVDVIGHSCDYDALVALCQRRGLYLIEDAAEAHGASYAGKPCGSFGHVSTFSFHANKAITTGEGGCVTTDDDVLAARMHRIANHGMTPGRWYYHDVIGSNYRMTNLTAAIGLAQVERWDELIGARTQIGLWYDKHCPAGVLPCPTQCNPACPSVWLYTVVTNRRDHVLTVLQQAGIDARPTFEALPDLPPYRHYSGFPNARFAARCGLMLPTWAGMTEALVIDICAVLQQATIVSVVDGEEVPCLM